MDLDDYLKSIIEKAQDIQKEIKENPENFNIHRVAAKFDFIVMHAQDGKRLAAAALTKSEK